MSKSYMTTMSEALNALAVEGWVESFELDGEGRISSGDQSWAPEAVSVHESHRFEGTSNPDDEAMVLAISVSDERRGVLVLPYGPDLSGAQADTIRALSGATQKQR